MLFTSKTSQFEGDLRKGIMMKGNKLYLLLSLGLLMSSGCAQMRRGETGLQKAIDNATTISADWGEVYCGEGTVCSEVDVRRVDIEQRDGGVIQVLLYNRTGYQSGFQIALEVLDANGALLDRTNYEDFGLQPRVEGRYEMPGIARANSKVRVLLRSRNANATIR